MKTKIASYLKRLNLVSVEAALFIFRSCFDFLAFSFEEISAEQVEVWIKQLNSSELEKIWMRQKGIKSPGSILYFVVWHFRDRVLQEQEYVREVVEKSRIAEVNSARVFEIIDPLNREIDKFSTHYRNFHLNNSIRITTSCRGATNDGRRTSPSPRTKPGPRGPRFAL